MCGNDTRSPVTSRESAAHGHTQREGKIHGARPPAAPSQSAGPPRPGPARSAPTAARAPAPRTWRPNSARVPLRKVTTLVSGECGPRLGPPCERLAASAPAGGGAGAHGLVAPHCAARPFVPARNAATPWRSGSTRAAAREEEEGGEDARWNGPRRRRQAGPTRAARRLSTLGGPAMERPRAAGEQLRGAGALALDRPVAAMEGCQREQRGGEPEAGEPPLGGTLPREAAEGARPPAAGSGVRRAPPPGGAAPSRAVPRRSVVPAARLEAGPARRSGCAPRRARGLPGWRWSQPGALGAPRDLCPPRST